MLSHKQQIDLESIAKSLRQLVLIMEQWRIHASKRQKQDNEKHP
jgi:hypothetical protein